MISVVFLKNLYYSPFLLPKTILIFGLFRIFVYGYKSLTNNGKKKEIIDREIPVQVASSQTGRRTFIPVFLTAVWTAVMSTSSCNSTSCRKHPPK